MNWFVLHFSLSLFRKCLKNYEISGFIELNCDKLHIYLFQIDLIQLIVKLISHEKLHEYWKPIIWI